jgi:transposase
MANSTASTPPHSTHMSVNLPTTLGLDLSDRQSHFHVQQGDGRTIATGKVAMEREDLAKLFEEWKGCRLVIEAGGHSAWVGRLGRECGMEVMVANPRQLELITKSDRKTDPADAKTLAGVGRSNPELLAPISPRSKEAQAHLAVLRARNEAVRVRTGLINHVRGVLKSHGHRAPSASPECFGGRAAASIPAELTAALMPMMKLIDGVNMQIKSYDKEIDRLGKQQYPITQLFQHISGVGPIVSLSFVLTIDDPKRFASGREVGAYLGLVPRKKSSGKSDPQMHITKAGDREMRRLLVLSANYILGRFGPDCDLRRFGMKIVGAGTDKTAKKRARVAVARKLAVLMHHLWRTGEVYDPLYLAKKRGESLPV